MRRRASQSGRSRLSHDIVDSATRSRMMSGIRGAHTKPEMLIRRGLHALGFRFRLHARQLPGNPDIVLSRHRVVIFVHGCFWHGHDCPLFQWPKSREAFWREKISGNRRRDIATATALEQRGWRVLQIWECALRGPGRLGSEKVIELASEWIRSQAPADEIRGGDAHHRTDRLA